MILKHWSHSSRLLRTNFRDVKLWASPWSPPPWMKWNKHYACHTTFAGMDARFNNHLSADRQGLEGTNMFIQENSYFKAYALYFSKFIESYNDRGIRYP